MIGQAMRRADHGFTLLELMIALAIAVFIMALVLPTGSRRGDRQMVSGAARDIAQSMRLARSSAVIHNRSAAIVFDIANAAYGSGKQVTVLPRGTQMTLRTAQSEELSATEGAIRFYPDGSSTGGGVTLARGATRFNVLVDWLTGSVSIKDDSIAVRR